MKNSTFLSAFSTPDEDMEPMTLDEWEKAMTDLADEARAMKELKEFAKTASKEEVAAKYHELRRCFGYGSKEQTKDSSDDNT